MLVIWGFTIQETALGLGVPRVCVWIPAFWTAFSSFSHFQGLFSLTPFIRNICLLYPFCLISFDTAQYNQRYEESCP